MNRPLQLDLSLPLRGGRRKGRVLADHFFSRILKTPTEVVNAIRYVLGNHTHHFAATGVDPFSSAGLSAADRGAVLAPPVGWLLRIGWRRAQRPRRTPMLSRPGFCS